MVKEYDRTKLSVEESKEYMRRENHVYTRLPNGYRRSVCGCVSITRYKWKNICRTYDLIQNSHRITCDRCQEFLNHHEDITWSKPEPEQEQESEPEAEAQADGGTARANAAEETEAEGENSERISELEPVDPEDPPAEALALVTNIKYSGDKTVAVMPGQSIEIPADAPNCVRIVGLEDTEGDDKW